ncbi:unnamed protein product [Meloidogyne enterolobii]|uniref:Uncharacterized protein n=1 Tax=Meloidogyne enterolobii TaxID=390850 RepID=A0ACB0Z106_MELEN
MYCKECRIGTVKECGLGKVGSGFWSGFKDSLRLGDSFRHRVWVMGFGNQFGVWIESVARSAC